MKQTKESGRQADNPDKEADARKWTKGSTGQAAVGAKPGRMKGNKQKAKYSKPESSDGKPVETEGGGR